MWNTLPGILRQNMRAVFQQELTAVGRSQEGTVVICGTWNTAGAPFENAVVIYKDPGYSLPKFPGNGNVVAVVDSCNPRLLEQVSETGLPAITCGLSARDTITLSSIGEENAVLSLQRSITCFDGTVAEPQDIPLSLSGPIDSFTLMASSCVFLLTGNAGKLKTAIF